MNYLEFEQAKEYRDRLLKLLDSGKSTLDANGFKSFSHSLSGKIKQLENEMANFEKSSCSSISTYFGLRTFNVTAQIAANASKSKFNILWNSPPQQTSVLPVIVAASQRRLLPEEEDSPLAMPAPA